MPKPRDKTRVRQATALARKRRKRAAHAARCRSFDEYLLALGATEPMMASDLPDVLRKRRNYEPSITSGARASAAPGVHAILAELRAVLVTATYPIAPTGPRVTLAAFFTDYVTTLHACRAGLQSPNAALAADSSRFSSAILDHGDENIRRGLRATIDALDAVLLRHCQINGCLYSLAYFNNVEPSGKAQMTMTLDCHQAESESFVLDGKSRPAWRCGLPFGTPGIQWATWTEEVRGASESGTLDVFVQSHALQRLYNRVPIERWAVQDWMWQSLKWPVLIPRGSGHWLVEFRFAGRRLGYFAATEVGAKIVVTTFLFLTMEGTPEGDILRRRLKVDRNDMSWLGMDTLRYFAFSDVGKDPGLRAIFTDCGCGHLFGLLKPGATFALREGVADNTRRYLDIPLPSV